MDNVYAIAAGEIAREAGQFLKHFSDGHRLAVENKGCDFDFVTNADRESQRLVATRLKERFPDHRSSRGLRLHPPQTTAETKTSTVQNPACHAAR